MVKFLKKGLTLIEAAMVLAIATLVVAGIMIFFASANMNVKTNEVLTQMTGVQSAVRTLYSSQPTFNGLTGQQIIDARLIPNKMVSGGNTIKHAFNGDIIIAPEDVGGIQDNGFSIELTNIPMEGCVKLGSHDYGTGVYDFEIAGTALTFPITVGQVTSLCQNTGNGGNTTMKWLYGN